MSSRARDSVITSNLVVMPENYASFQEAVDEARTKGCELVLTPGAHYVLTAAITGAYVTIRGNGATIDISGLASNATGITAAGTNSVTGTALSANATAGATSLLVASATGISAGTWLFLRSSAVFASVEGVTYGEWVRCKTIVATTVTLYAPIAYTYNTADSAAVDVLAPVGDFTWQDFTIVGSGAGTQRGALIDRAVNVQVRNVSTDLCWNSGLAIRRSYGVDIAGGSFERANQVGISYGVIIYDGCAGVSVRGVTGFDLRHAVTVGGTGGVNRGILVENSKAFASRDAGFDCHAGTDGVLFTGLYVEGGSTSVDGVVMQGINCTARDIEVRGIQRHGVLMQNNASPTSNATVVDGVRGDADQHLVLVNAYGGDVSAASVEDVLGNGGYSLVAVNADAGRTISRVAVRNVASASALPVRAVHLFATGASAAITNGSVTDCDFTMSGGASEIVYLQSTGGGAISGIELDSIRASGGTYSIRLNDASNCIIGDRCMLSGASSAAVGWGAGTGNRGYRYSGSATYNPPNLADGAGTTTTVTVTGAVLGDAVTECSFSLDLQGITVTPYVSAADTVSVRFQNESGGPLDLASGTLRVAVVRMNT